MKKLNPSTLPPKGRKHFLLKWLFLLFVMCGANAFAQSITGTVKARNNDVIPGASILIKGTTKGTTANADGAFTISAQANQTLVISSIGYQSKELIVGNKNNVTIILDEDQSALNEVVVVGYGTQKKIDLTGSVSRVNLEIQQGAPNTNIAQFLQGSVPGLNVGISTVSGGTPSIAIRGQATVQEYQELAEDGIIAMPIPDFLDDDRLQ